MKLESNHLKRNIGMTEMKTIDHIAIVVDNIKESIAYYVVEHQARILYCDKSWGLLQFKNVNLALVLEGEHPPHIAFEVDEIENKYPTYGMLQHRDGSISKYIEDPSGNHIEIIEYPK